MLQKPQEKEDKESGKSALLRYTFTGLGLAAAAACMIILYPRKVVKEKIEEQKKKKGHPD